MPLAVTSATGKLGGGVLNAILENKLIDPQDLVICVSLPLYIRFSPLMLPPDIFRPKKQAFRCLPLPRNRGPPRRLRRSPFSHASVLRMRKTFPCLVAENRDGL